MKNERKQITTVVDVDNINELPATIAEFTANLCDNEHLAHIDVKLSLDKERKMFYSVEFQTLVGDKGAIFPNVDC